MLSKIFVSGLKIAFLSFGGGSSAIPFIKNEYLNNRKWVNEDEFNKMMILSTMLPGPTISQLVMLISKKQGGIIGAIIGLSGLLFAPPIVLIITLSLMNNYLSEEILNKISMAIIPIVIFMLINFIKDFFMQSVKKNGFGTSLIICITTFILYNLFNLNILIIFIIAIILIVIYSNIKGLSYE